MKKKTLGIIIVSVLGAAAIFCSAMFTHQYLDAKNSKAAFDDLTNLITEILAAAVWLIAVASAGPDRLIVGVFSFPLLILVPICGWLLMPISKKILKKAKD